MPFGGVYTPRSQGELRTFTFDFFGDMQATDQLVSASSVLKCPDDANVAGLLVATPVIMSAWDSYTGSSFMGYASGNILYVQSVPSVPLVPRASVSGGGATAGTFIVKQLAGATGGIGSYQLNIAQSVGLGLLSSSYKISTVVSQQIGVNSSNLVGFLSALSYSWTILAKAQSNDILEWTMSIPVVPEPE